jgi:hypothetical protein
LLVIEGRQVQPRHPGSQAPGASTKTGDRGIVCGENAVQAAGGCLDKCGGNLFIAWQSSRRFVQNEIIDLNAAAGGDFFGGFVELDADSRSDEFWS